MLSFARKKEIEKSSFPLWLITFAVSKLKNTDCISYEKYIEKIMNDLPSYNQNKDIRPPEEIISELSNVADFCRKESEK